MLERAQRIGATLTVESSPGAGTRVVLSLPPKPVSLQGDIPATNLPEMTESTP